MRGARPARSGLHLVWRFSLNIDTLAQMWTTIAGMHPSQIVGRLSHLVTDEQPLPGFVGRNYSGGTLLIGMNPANDISGDSGAVIYEALRSLDGTEESFWNLNQLIQESMPTWPVYGSAIQPLLEKAGQTIADIAFLNILPLRADRANRARLYDVAWSTVTRKQVVALQPKLILCLGKEAYDFVRTMWTETPVYLIRRPTGDKTTLPTYRDTQDDIARVARYMAPSKTAS